jgi:hypothetical protein
MTNKKLISLAVTAVVLGALAYVSTSSKKLKAPSLVGQAVLKDIDLSEVQKLEIGGEKKLVLESADGGWVIRSLFGYPADIAKIRENLLKLKDLKIGHVATGKKLEKPVLVDLQNASGKSLATLCLGEKHMRQSSGEMDPLGGGGYPDGRYVAAGGGDTVALVKETLDAFDGDPKSWTETQICSVPAADITDITLTGSGQTVKLAKKDGAWTLAGLGEKEEFDTSKSYALESALSYLNFSTVADPALTDETLGMTTGSVYHVSLKTGESYTARVGSPLDAGTDRSFKISASFSPVGTNATENAELAKKVETFNGKAGKWTYVIPAYNAENMTKRRADLVKAKEEPKAEELKSEAPEKEEAK